MAAISSRHPTVSPAMSGSTVTAGRPSSFCISTFWRAAPPGTAATTPATPPLTPPVSHASRPLPSGTQMPAPAISPVLTA